MSSPIKTGLPPELEQRRIFAEAAAELRHDLRRLELERWTHSRQDPDTAIQQLVLRERFTPPPADPPRNHIGHTTYFGPGGLLAPEPLIDEWSAAS